MWSWKCNLSGPLLHNVHQTILHGPNGQGVSNHLVKGHNTHMSTYVHMYDIHVWMDMKLYPKKCSGVWTERCFCCSDRNILMFRQEHSDVQTGTFCCSDRNILHYKHMQNVNSKIPQSIVLQLFSSDQQQQQQSMDSVRYLSTYQHRCVIAISQHCC